MDGGTLLMMHEHVARLYSGARPAYFMALVNKSRWALYKYRHVPSQASSTVYQYLLFTFGTEDSLDTNATHTSLHLFLIQLLEVVEHGLFLSHIP